MKTIARFDGEWAGLSNFAPCPIQLGGLRFPTVEHAYQAAKNTDIGYRRLVQAAATPGQAKRLGAKVVLRPGWNELRLQVMELCLRQKFGRPAYRALLLSTDAAELVEGNTWGDTFWGMVEQQRNHAVGENHLGRLLMKIRAELKEEI